MILCRHCYKEMDDGALFCDNCGHELTARETDPKDRRTGAPAFSPPAGNPQGGVRFATPSPASPDARAARSAAPAATVAPDGGGPAADADIASLVIILVEVASNAQFTLRGKRDYIIGRTVPGKLSTHHAPLDVDLEPYEAKDAGVSRRHLAIHVRSQGVFVEDLESTNETAQNGFRLMPLQLYPLHHGDDLLLGGLQLRVVFQRV